MLQRAVSHLHFFGEQWELSTGRGREIQVDRQIEEKYFVFPLEKTNIQLEIMELGDF